MRQVPSSSLPKLTDRTSSATAMPVSSAGTIAGGGAQA